MQTLAAFLDADHETQTHVMQSREIWVDRDVADSMPGGPATVLDREAERHRLAMRYCAVRDLLKRLIDAGISAEKFEPDDDAAIHKAASAFAPGTGNSSAPRTYLVRTAADRFRVVGTTAEFSTSPAILDGDDYLIEIAGDLRVEFGRELDEAQLSGLTSERLLKFGRSLIVVLPVT